MYMSPEQVEGKAVDHRSDLYSFGLIFYEMLTGILPFSGDSTFQLMYQRVHQLPKRPELVIQAVRNVYDAVDGSPIKQFDAGGQLQ